jgi:hypothetical protein
VQTRIVTALLGVGADPDQLPTAGVIDLCAIIALRHIGAATEIAQSGSTRHFARLFRDTDPA